MNQLYFNTTLMLGVNTLIVLFIASPPTITFGHDQVIDNLIDGSILELFGVARSRIGHGLLSMIMIFVSKNYSIHFMLNFLPIHTK